MPPSHDRTRWRTHSVAYQMAAQRASHAPRQVSAADRPAACPQKACCGCSGVTRRSLSQLACLSASPRPRTVAGSCANHQHREFCSRIQPRCGSSRKRLGRKVRPERRADRFLERRAQEPFSRSCQFAGALWGGTKNVGPHSPDTAGTRELPVLCTRDSSPTALRRAGRIPAYYVDSPTCQPVEVARGSHDIWPAARTGGAA